MRAPGLAEVVAAKEDGRWSAAYAPQRDVEVPTDLAVALAENQRAATAFERLDKTGQYAISLPVLKASASGRAMRVRRAIAKLEAEG